MDITIHNFLSLKYLIEAEQKYLIQTCDLINEYKSNNNAQINNILNNIINTNNRSLLISNNNIILENINLYLKENCNHDIITDDIDISIFKSKRIKYCNICNTQF